MAEVLSETTHTSIKRFCERGDLLADEGKWDGAIEEYEKAWALLPPPPERWEAATWILTAIGDAEFGRTQYASSADAFEKALHCPGGLGNPFVHLRLGESMFELGDLDRALDELTRAYMGGGREIFEDEDPKYLELIQKALKPRFGERSL